jgi:hypothetical protein
MNCPHGRKPLACEACHPNGPPEPLLKAIDLIAEAKTLALLITRATVVGSEQRRRLMVRLHSVNGDVAKHLRAVGYEAFPHGLLVQARACELLIERLQQE